MRAATLIVLSASLACLLGDVIDRVARPGRLRFGATAAILFRWSVCIWLWAVAMCVSQRPFYSLLAATATMLTLALISNQKRESLREPLVFSDLVFVAQVFRHPSLFYLRQRDILLGAALGVAVVIATAVWWQAEPRAVSVPGLAMLAALAILLPVMPHLAWSGAILDRLAATVAPEPTRDAHVADLGLAASLAVYWVRWLNEDRSGRPPAPPRVDEVADYEAVLVIQAESFVDLRRHGTDALHLPAYDALKRRATLSGLIDVPCYGAYTLRPEAAVITGHGFDQAGFGGFHPYLRPGRIADAALPHLLPVAWRKLFLHPFVPTFFRRDAAIPRFGFDSFIDATKFDEADRDGPYVGDLAVARHILAALAQARRDRVGVYLQVVTMEAHDPFGPGRLPHVSGATAQFIHHLGNADRMLALLAEELDRQADRVLLVHYGDHVPLLEDYPGSFVDPRTDVLIVELGRRAQRTPAGVPVTRPEHLYRFIVDRLRLAGTAT